MCVGLVAYHGGLPAGAFGGQVGPAELAYVPSNAAVVAFADVQEVMNSDLRQRLKAVMPADEHDRDEFQKQTGIDVERDIDHVVACLLPGEGQDSGFVALRGHFDMNRLEAMAREHGAVIDQYKGKKLIHMAEHRTEPVDENEPRAHRRHGSPAIAFVEGDLIMVGDVAAIRSAIDTQAAGSSVTGNAELRNLIDSVDNNANAWAVGRFDLLASRANLPSQVASQIPAVKWFAASGHINGGVSGMLRAEARDEQAAQNLRDVVNGFLALGRMQAGAYPEAQAMMQSLQLGGSGKTVELSFTVPSELLDSLQKMAGEHRHRREGL